MGINPKNNQHHNQTSPEQNHFSPNKKNGGYHFAG
jgi:hypothetical protein